MYVCRPVYVSIYLPTYCHRVNIASSNHQNTDPAHLALLISTPYISWFLTIPQSLVSSFYPEWLPDSTRYSRLSASPPFLHCPFVCLNIILYQFYSTFKFRIHNWIGTWEYFLKAHPITNSHVSNHVFSISLHTIYILLWYIFLMHKTIKLCVSISSPPCYSGATCPANALNHMTC